MMPEATGTPPFGFRGTGKTATFTVLGVIWRMSDKTGQYPKFRNDHAAPEIRIGAKEFNCIGASPPQDHPNVYLNMGSQNTILCPYCATRFLFDPWLKPSDAVPPECVYTDLPVGDLLPKE